MKILKNAKVIVDLMELDLLREENYECKRIISRIKKYVTWNVEEKKLEVSEKVFIELLSLIIESEDEATIVADIGEDEILKRAEVKEWQV